MKPTISDTQRAVLVKMAKGNYSLGIGHVRGLILMPGFPSVRMATFKALLKLELIKRIDGGDGELYYNITPLGLAAIGKDKDDE